MKTEAYPHKTAAVYPDEETSADAVRALRAAAIENIDITTLRPGKADVSPAIEPEMEETRNRAILDTLYGTATGGAAAAVTAGAIAVAIPALFVSASVVAPLIVLGYGAVIGGTAGAILGIKPREGMLAGMVRDALKAGFYVVIVHAADHEAQHQAEAVISHTMADKSARS